MICIASLFLSVAFLGICHRAVAVWLFDPVFLSAKWRKRDRNVALAGVSFRFFGLLELMDPVCLWILVYKSPLCLPMLMLTIVVCRANNIQSITYSFFQFTSQSMTVVGTIYVIVKIHPVVS